MGCLQWFTMMALFSSPEVRRLLLSIFFLFASHHKTVIAIYSRTGARYRSNAWVPEATSIGQVSYVTVQLYEHHRGSIFCTILRSRSHLRVKSFAHLRPPGFLCSLPIMAVIRPDGNSADLALPSYNIWLELEACASLIPSLVSALKKRKSSESNWFHSFSSHKY